VSSSNNHHSIVVAIAGDWAVFTGDSGFQDYAKVLPIKRHALRK
jgi:hypothetical protein